MPSLVILVILGALTALLGFAFGVGGSGLFAAQSFAVAALGLVVVAVAQGASVIAGRIKKLHDDLAREAGGGETAGNRRGSAWLWPAE